MDTKQLMQDYPLAKNRLKGWFLDKLTANMENFEEDEAFKKFMIESGITDDQIENIFKEGGRACLDMFDEYNLYVSIIYSDGGFKSMINDESIGTSFPNRKSAESAVLEQCVKMLEDLLTEQLTENEDTNDNSEN